MNVTSTATEYYPSRNLERLFICAEPEQCVLIITEILYHNAPIETSLIFG